jgi:hypothetical protein
MNRSSTPNPVPSIGTSQSAEHQRFVESASAEKPIKQPPKIEILHCEPHDGKNPLAHFEICINDLQVISGIPFFAKKDDKPIRINWPSRKIEGPYGREYYSPYIRWKDKRRNDWFLIHVSLACESYYNSLQSEGAKKWNEPSGSIVPRAEIPTDLLGNIPV